jgi:hypothetical protein
VFPSRVGSLPCLTRKYNTRLGRDEHASLFVLFVGDETFYEIGARHYIDEQKKNEDKGKMEPEK